MAGFTTDQAAQRGNAGVGRAALRSQLAAKHGTGLRQLKTAWDTDNAGAGAANCTIWQGHRSFVEATQRPFNQAVHDLRVPTRCYDRDWGAQWTVYVV